MASYITIVTSHTMSSNWSDPHFNWQGLVIHQSPGVGIFSVLEIQKILLISLLSTR